MMSAQEIDLYPRLLRFIEGLGAIHFCTNYHLLKKLFSVWSALPFAAAVLHQTETSSSRDRVRGTHAQALWLLQSHSKWILLMDYLGLFHHHCQQLIHLGWCRLSTALAGDGSGNTQIHLSPQNERRRPSGLRSGTPRGCSLPAETKKLGVSSFGQCLRTRIVRETEQR